MDNMRRGNNPKRSRNGRPGGRHNGHGGGGGKPPMGMNRSMESNTPDGNKVRGNAAQLYERYTSLARDAQSAGDRIAAEGYLQYAEHYYRVLSAAGWKRGQPPNQGGRPLNPDGTPQEGAPPANGNGQPTGVMKSADPYGDSDEETGELSPAAVN
jgi:hypothetical protein